MKDFTSKIPLPITALALSWVILGNVFQGIVPFLSDFCMVVSIILLILSTLRILRHPKHFFDFIKTSTGMALFSSFSLSLIMISVWMRGVFGKANIYIWVAGVILHTFIFIVFTAKYIINIKEAKVNPTWFLIYSGLGLSIVTCRDFGMVIFGKFMFNFVFSITVVLIPLVIFALYVDRSSEKNAFRPYFTMITLPVGILISAYISIYLNANISILMNTFYLLQLLFLILLVSIFIQVFNGFYPSWSSYALGSSIMLYGASEINQYMISRSKNSIYMDIIINTEYILVFLICIIVLIAYLINISEGEHFVTEKLKLESSEKLKRARNIVPISKHYELDKKREERLQKREERRRRKTQKRAVDEKYIEEFKKNSNKKNFDELYAKKNANLDNKKETSKEEQFNKSSIKTKKIKKRNVSEKKESVNFKNRKLEDSKELSKKEKNNIFKLID